MFMKVLILFPWMGQRLEFCCCALLISLKLFNRPAACIVYYGLFYIKPEEQLLSHETELWDWLLLFRKFLWMALLLDQAK